MSNKVKLPKNVADAIETLRSMDFKVTNWDIVYAFAVSKADEYPALIEFARNDFDTLLQALVNGYEVEISPEDKVREYYKQQNSISTDDQDTAARVIRNVLNFLEINIEGVNA